MVYVSLGLLYQEMGNLKAARTNLQKAQELFIAQDNTVLAERTANLLKELP